MAGVTTDRTLRRRELASFLRSRRERISPEQVGLPRLGRRRTPGLRREEVAQLAGVGVTWYTWLEQGRDINVSSQVLTALCRTLMLDAGERSHLFTLAGVGIVNESAKACNAVPDPIRIILHALPYPASVNNSRRDILVSNALSEAIWGPYRDWEERNVLVHLFITKRWCPISLDWEHSAPRLVAEFRAAMARHMGEPAWTGLLERLLAESPEFAELWARHDVLTGENVVKRVRSRDVGLLHLNITHLWFGPTSDLRLTAYTPVDTVTETRLARLRKLVAERAA